METIERLRCLNWRVLVIWECSLRGKNRHSVTTWGDLFHSWFESDAPYAEITSSGLIVTGVLDTESNKSALEST